MTNIMAIDKIEKIPIYEFTEKAYLNYANYVIMDRALPSIGDGLKPVQRRIIYAMSELGLKTTAKYKKSARTVGDVLGKFHPHGDTACYEAMVLMTQPFSYRYPIIDGQGNWGAPENPKSFAAMRYTEAKLSKYANNLLLEIEMGTVNWQSNFDDTLTEPKELPARLPNILLNGTTGIAVGMATAILPHNINEIIAGCIKIIDKPDIDNKEIFKYIHGPDFPTGGKIITPIEEIIKIYSKGIGSIKVRSTYKFEKGTIIITELPYQVSPLKIIEQITNQIHNKKIPISLTVRDESNHENPIRLVIIPPNNIKNVDRLMSHFFATTDLEKTFRINMNVIGINGRPEVKNLLTLLKEWISFRKQIIKNRLKDRFKKVKDRIEILMGLLIVYANTNRLIRIIKDSTAPKKTIKRIFELTDRQSEFILNLRLQNLASLEKVKIKLERDKLIKENNNIKKILHSEVDLKNLIKKELKLDLKKYSDNRRTEIMISQKANALNKIDWISPKYITVILSKNGWVRKAKGETIKYKNLLYKIGDSYLDNDKGFDNTKAIFFNSFGRAYTLYPYTLPSARGYGEPLSLKFKVPPESSFNSIKMYTENKTQFFVLSNLGYGFITSKKMNFPLTLQGKILLTLSKNSKAMPIIKIREISTDLIAIFTNTGKLLILPLKKLQVQIRCGKGNKIIQINKKEYVKEIQLTSVNEKIIVFAGKQYLIISRKNMFHYIGSIGDTGKKLPRGFQKITRTKVIL